MMKYFPLSEEMAQFLMELYQSSKVVGLVDVTILNFIWTHYLIIILINRYNMY